MTDTEVSEVTKLLRKESHKATFMFIILIALIMIVSWFEFTDRSRKNHEDVIIMMKKVSELCKKECGGEISRFAWNNDGASCECMGVLLE